MNRLRVLKQRAAREGIGMMRNADAGKAWDVVDSCGPRGEALTYRAAVNLAAAIAKKQKSRMYGTDASGKWHRWNCEKVAAPFVKSRPCDCSRLVVSPVTIALSQ